MTIIEMDQKRLDATAVWLEYARIFPNTKLSIYDYLYKGYSLDETKAFFQQAVMEKREISIGEIADKNVHLP